LSSIPAPTVIVVSAPSGAGKSTLLGRVLRKIPGLRFSVSHTTRKPRPGEQDGVEYHFVDRDAFARLREAGRLLEWAEVHGNLYGTGFVEYERAEHERADLLLDIDVAGAAQVRMKVDDAVTIFVLPPSFDDLEVRLRKRGLDGAETIERRLANAREEASLYGEYDYTLVNDDLDRCVESIECVIRAARLRTARMAPEADRILKTFRKPQRSKA
jgi:guanylate kinase